MVPASTEAVGPSSEGGRGRVGVEIELARLSVDEATRVVERELGGSSRRAGTYERIVDTPHGEFRVELDSGWLKRVGEAAQREGPLGAIASDALEAVASELVPCEIATPPLAREALGVVDGLGAALGRAGGRGTFDALRFGFGVHFNPELLRPELPTVLATMRAFALLYETLKSAYHVDLTRRVTVFIDPWPKAYVERLLSEHYRPASFGELIDDYLAYTPSRNRALDMLPLFAHLDEARVRAAAPEQKIKPRPTFHYRLCNSRVGDPGWAVSQEWTSWREVEALARDRDRRRELQRRFWAGEDLSRIAALAR